jgi:hypothetical protein
MQQEINRRDMGIPTVFQGDVAFRNVGDAQTAQRQDLMNNYMKQYSGMQGMVDQGMKNDFANKVAKSGLDMQGLQADVASKWSQMAYNNALIQKFNAEAAAAGQAGSPSQAQIQKIQLALAQENEKLIHSLVPAFLTKVSSLCGRIV